MTLSMTKIRRGWPRWYRGDFHAHTFHTDGVLSPPQLVQEALEARLDFISITDHNVITAFPHFVYPDPFLVIPGVEVTMDYGHFNVFGLESAPDWLATLPTTREAYMRLGEEPPDYSPTELLRLAKEQGFYTSINHPLLAPWAWLDKETDLTYVDFVEIWNDPSWPDNDTATPAAIELWTKWLNAGFRITAIGGTDFHTPRPEPQKDGSIVAGNKINEPTTYVYADELSGRAIMQGLLNRHAYVSMGPTIAFTATCKDAQYMIGEDLGQLDGPLNIITTARYTGTITLQLVKNGEVICQATGDNQISLQTTLPLTPSEPVWYRVDIRNQDNQYIAVTNPIFTGPPREPETTKYGDFL